MDGQTDIRWIQRYANFHKACSMIDISLRNQGTKEEVSEKINS